MDFIEIRCQEKYCPYEKAHCCFGEVCVNCLHNEPIVVKHKCKFAKAKDILQYVIVKVSKPVA